MKKLSRKELGIEDKLPVKVLQFGEGNFLRAFVDYAFQKLNDEANFNAGVAVVQPLDKGLVKLLSDQDGLYTLFLKGFQKGVEIQKHELIRNVVKAIDPYASFDQYLELAREESLEFVVSNTTEAGIAYLASDEPDMCPPASFPGKLTVFLYERFRHFQGAADKGLCIIPCELINYNADVLKDIILQYVSDWNLGEDFKRWINQHNSFHNTLVDRIVPGYPKDEIEDYNQQLDYADQLIVTAETFFLWVIEGDDILRKKLPFERTSLDVKIVDNMQPYRTRKVRILNGAHTAVVPFSILYGNTLVKETVEDQFTGEFIREAVFNEILQTLEMDKAELRKFAEEVFDRFRNPFIKHQLSSIALNSISKFKVRVLPSLLEYKKLNNALPVNLTFSFACLLRFYQGIWMDKKLPVQDDRDILDFFTKVWLAGNIEEVVHKSLKNEALWGQDLSKVEGLEYMLTMALEEIMSNGIEEGFSNYKNRVNKAQTDHAEKIN
ncbi:tagaturonate reductase [Fulvivirga kasyanovii]|uniref:Tagaturonate reductase n=1 Tax=Fulvivirga kasyanovii TaxID=396812 RepID=A0ABW9RL60_9BACT|nr:tagaturonate reductase [Fulvivirga kasyanovii]MTI24832.1 tagaturonate reductase [Fulvivirga kasyanovii]